MQLDWQRQTQLTREVERVNLRYQTEVVEAFGFCPWAKEARSGGRVKLQVTFMTEPDPLETLRLLDLGMADPAIEVAMLIFPLLALPRLTFAHFAATVRSADDARTPRGQQRFALAEFHPSADPQDAQERTDPSRSWTPQTLIPFLRRAPDPMIQSVRMEVLARVRGTENHGTSYVDPAQLAEFALTANTDVTPPLAARVAQHNHRTVQRVGLSQIERVFRAIDTDRRRAYAALGVAAPTHAYIDDTNHVTSGNALENEGPQGG